MTSGPDGPIFDFSGGRLGKPAAGLIMPTLHFDPPALYDRTHVVSFTTL